MSKTRFIVLAIIFIVPALFVVAAADKPVPTADHPDAWKGLTPEQVQKVKAGEVVLLDQDASDSGEDQKIGRANV